MVQNVTNWFVKRQYFHICSSSCTHRLISKERTVVLIRAGKVDRTFLLLDVLERGISGIRLVVYN